MVLDEATAFADPENEGADSEGLCHTDERPHCYYGLHTVYPLLWALIRLSFLKKGHIVEQGTHAELTASGGLYARMWTDYNKAVQWKITSEKEAE